MREQKNKISLICIIMGFWNKLTTGIRHIGKGIKTGAGHIKNYAGKAREKIQHIRKIGKGVYDAVSATPVVGDYLRAKEKELMNKRFSAGGVSFSAGDVMKGMDRVENALGRTQRIAGQVSKGIDGDAEAIRSLYGQGRTGYNQIFNR